MFAALSAIPPSKNAPQRKSRESGVAYVSGKNGGHTLDLHRMARDRVHLLGPVSGASGATRRLTGDLHENLAEADGSALFATQVIDGFIARTCMDVPPAENEPPMRGGFAAASVRELDLAAAGITSVVWATGYRHDFRPDRHAAHNQSRLSGGYRLCRSCPLAEHCVRPGRPHDMQRRAVLRT